MADFAEIDSDNTVIRVCVGDEAVGISWFQEHLGGTWLESDRNSYRGIHFGANGEPDNLPSLRKNFASVGDTYDSTRDAFISPQPFQSWILNESTCAWEAPTPYPTDGRIYQWVETDLNWRVNG